MKLVRFAIGGAALFLAVSPVVGHAANGGGTSASGLAAGSAVVGECDNAVTITYQGAPGDVTGVVVGNLATACATARLQLTVVDSSGTSVASGTVSSVSDTSVTVSVSPNPSPAQAKGVRLVLVGP